MIDWFTLKLLASELTGTSRDALHVVFGVAGQLIAAGAFRKSVAHPLPWFCVLAAECLNEWHDLTHEVWLDRPMWPGSVHDVVITMALPTLLLALARWTPRLFFPFPSEPVPAAPTDDQAKT